MFISQQKTGDTCKSKAIDQTTSFQGSSSKKKTIAQTTDF